MAKNFIFAISIVATLLLGCTGKSKYVAPDSTDISLSTFLKDPHRYAGREIHIGAYVINVIPKAFILISDVKDPYLSDEKALHETIFGDIRDHNFNYFGKVIEGKYYKFPVVVRIEDNGNFRCIASGYPKRIFLSPPQLSTEIIPSPSQPTQKTVLSVSGPIYTTFELLAKYETIPRDKPIWVVGYIISERSSISDIFKICTLDAFTTDPEKLKGGVFHITDRTYYEQAEWIYFERTGTDNTYLHIDVWKECKEVARSKSNLVVGKKFAFKVELKNKGMGRLVDTAPDIQLIE